MISNLMHDQFFIIINRPMINYIYFRLSLGINSDKTYLFETWHQQEGSNFQMGILNISYLGSGMIITSKESYKV